MNALASLSEVSVAVLSCNRRDELRKTLEGLLALGPIWHEIIVADNASADGTGAMVRKGFPDVHLIETGGNVGVAGANQAFRAATGEWVLSLDDDSCPDLNTWGPLSGELHTNSQWGAITCSVQSSGASQVRSSDGEVLHPYFGFHQAGGLLKRSTIEKLGGFDEDLFLWGVELHLAARAVLAGLEFARCDSALVVHRNSPANRSGRRHAFHYCRNLFLLLLRYAPKSSVHKLISEFLSNVITYSALHRTTAYLSAVKDAQLISRKNQNRDPLSEEQFSKLCPDLRAPFSYLG